MLEDKMSDTFKKMSSGTRLPFMSLRKLLKAQESTKRRRNILSCKKVLESSGYSTEKFVKIQ